MCKLVKMGQTNYLFTSRKDKDPDKAETKKAEDRRHVGWWLDCRRRNWSTLLPLNVHFLFVLTGQKPLWSTHNGDSNGGRLTGRETEEMGANVAYEVFTVWEECEWIRGCGFDSGTWNNMNKQTNRTHSSGLLSGNNQEMIVRCIFVWLGLQPLPAGAAS